MKKEELIRKIAEMLREKHGDPKGEGNATNLTSSAGRRSIAEDVVNLLLQETRLKENENELTVDIANLGGSGGSGSNG